MTSYQTLYKIPKPEYRGNLCLDPDLRELRAMIGIHPFTQNEFITTLSDYHNIPEEEASQKFQEYLKMEMIELHKEVPIQPRPRTI